MVASSTLNLAITLTLPGKNGCIWLFQTKQQPLSF